LISTAEQFRGQRHPLSVLQAYLAAGRLGGCVLLLGQRGLGKTTLATIAARALCCERNTARTELWFCGECYACRSIASGDQPEYVTVRPLGADIKVEQLGEKSGVLYSFSLHPLHLSHRILLIDEAHCLNVQTANQMLKLLEEPPERSLFFLVTDQPQQMLPTILSRGLKVYCTAEPAAALEGYLAQDLPQAAAAARSAAALMACGRYTDARLLAGDDQWRGAVRQLAAALSAVRGIPPAAAALAEYEFAALWAKELADTGLDEGEAEKQCSDSYKEAKDGPPRQLTKARLNEIKRQALISAYDRGAWWALNGPEANNSSRGLPMELSPALGLLKQRIHQNVDPLLAQTAFELMLHG
jgi:hypothetical protein